MQVIKLGKLIAPLSLVLLAACQNTQGPVKTSSEPTMPAASTAPVGQVPPTVDPAAQASMPAQGQGVPVAVYIADTAMQSGWTPVTLQSGTLYINPEPVITKTDLTGVQAGSNKSGDGLLALELNALGKGKITDATTKNANKRLALVVGRTLLAVPGYSAPVTSSQLIFAVGSEENATTAARAIAGVAADDRGTPGTSSGAPAAATGFPANGGLSPTTAPR